MTPFPWWTMQNQNVLELHAVNLHVKMVPISVNSSQRVSWQLGHLLSIVLISLLVIWVLPNLKFLSPFFPSRAGYILIFAYVLLLSWNKVLVTVFGNFSLCRCKFHEGIGSQIYLLSGSACWDVSSTGMGPHV